MRIKGIIFLLLIIPCSFLSGCTALFFQPTRYKYSNPLDEGYSCEAMYFNSKDGTRLTGLWFPATAANPKGTVVHFHGNGQNMTAHYRHIGWIALHGYNVFTFDYRGYGASSGTAGKMGHAAEDSEAALQAVLEMPGVDPDKIILFGQSLGSAMAIAAAAESDFAPAALVLEGSFYSYKSMARAYLTNHWVTWPLLWLPSVAITGSYAPKDEIQKINAPKLFLHSVNDQIVPYSQGKKLYEASPGPKEFWDVPNGHIEAFTFYGNYFSPRLLKFLDEALNGKKEEHNGGISNQSTETGD